MRALCAWRVGVSLDVISYSSNIINILLYPSVPYKSYLCSLIYGPPTTSAKKYFWNSLLDIGNTFQGSWLILGDFNSISNKYEKRRGSLLISSFTPSGLSLVMTELGVLDVRFNGYRYTWDKKRNGFANIQE